MLDTLFHQGAGLHSITPQTPLRMVAVASQDHASDGLETLWHICAHLQSMGYPTIVLDGTARETDDSPGLIHLLSEHTLAPPMRPSGETHEGRTTSIAVMPAALGLSYLSREASSASPAPLQAIYDHFRSYGVVVVHTPASTLGALLSHTDTQPLVMLRPSPEGVLNAYKSLKHIALTSGLTCTVAAMVHGNTASRRKKAQDALLALSDCARHHLGNATQGTLVHPNEPHDIQRLALHLLENAGTIRPAAHMLASTRHMAPMAMHLMRSH